MGSPSPRRILLAIEPVVLETALATLLAEAGVDDVVSFHVADPAMLDGHYDAAVVAMPLPEVDAAVVVRLPDTGGNAGIGSLSLDGQVEPVVITTHADIVDLLDVHCPAVHPRSATA